MSDTSFENLVNEHGRQVLRTALRVLRDANLAHDVHQEVFLAIWRRWHRYNGNVNWPAYLYRATVRKALELARQRLVRSGPVSNARQERREECEKVGSTCLLTFRRCHLLSLRRHYEQS